MYNPAAVRHSALALTEGSSHKNSISGRLQVRTCIAIDHTSLCILCCHAAIHVMEPVLRGIIAHPVASGSAQPRVAGLVLFGTDGHRLVGFRWLKVFMIARGRFPCYPKS